MLMRLAFGAEFSFSLSSASLAEPDTSRSRLTSVVGRRDDTDVRRASVGVGVFAKALGGPAMDAREDDADGIRVGVASFAPAVPDAEFVREMLGGGPIVPSSDRFLTVVAVDAAPFARTLRVSAGFTVEGVSTPLPFSVDGVSANLPFVVLPVSDSTEDGRNPFTLGVPKMEDSRR